MATEIQEAGVRIRRDTAANWTSNDPTPLEGEWCLETDTKSIKIGDGATAWTSLDYNIIPETICTAWVNFNGTGTVAIRDSYNVDSITDGGEGIYTINFTNALADSNYCVALSTTGLASGSLIRTVVVDGTPNGGATLKSTTQLKINTGSPSTSSTVDDMAEINVIIFGGVA